MVTDTIKRTMIRRAAKATVRHSAHGVVARVQRKPARSAGLIGFGVVVGAAAGWLGRGLGR